MPIPFYKPSANLSLRLACLVLCFYFCCTTATSQLTYETLRVVYDSAWTFKNLKLIPVRFKDPGGTRAVISSKEPGIITLSEAMQQKKVKVKEIKYQHGADVNTLEITNHSKQNILLSSGEMLSGGKQDRMLSETKIIPPGKGKNYVNVFCIEKGRWDKKPKSFSSNGRADVELRKVMDLNKRQSDIWKEIQRRYATVKRTSETWPYLKLYKELIKTDSSYLRFFMSKYNASDSAFAGFIAVTGTRIISCELFSSVELTRASFFSILLDFIQTAVANGEPPGMRDEDVGSFMDKLLISETSQKDFVAKHGKMYKFENRVIHIVVYGE
jgi:hypothetical protein